MSPFIPMDSLLGYARNIWPQALLYTLIFSGIFVSAVIYYRLFLSPLAKFPGPRLAACTRLYETYFQIIKGGVFPWHIERLHEEYGPIVRISPWELHVQDPDFYSVLYAPEGRHRNKDPWFSFIGYPRSIFSIEAHALHRDRRKVLSHFFKKGAVQLVEPLIQDKIDLLCRHFSKANNTKQPLELQTLFYAFASDVLSQYAFGTPNGFRFLEDAHVSDQWKQSLTAMFDLCRFVRHFHFLPKLAHVFPAITCWIVPIFGEVYRMEEQCKAKMRAVMAQHGQADMENNKGSALGKASMAEKPVMAVYPSILADPNVPQREKRLAQMEDDAIFLMMAGTDAPAQSIASVVFHILNNPAVYQRLKTELASAFPNLNTIPTLEELRQVPYLSAVVRESLRLTGTVTTRLPRSAPDEVLHFRQWEIPAGTFVSMSSHFVMRDPSIFPEPLSFLPERWMVDPEELRRLEKYLVPGSKGSLGCLGQNMAWAWMHHIVATLIRRFDLVLHDTTEKNVEMTRDNFIGQTDAGINNIQVKVMQEYVH